MRSTGSMLRVSMRGWLQTLTNFGIPSTRVWISAPGRELPLPRMVIAPPSPPPKLTMGLWREMPTPGTSLRADGRSWALRSAICSSVTTVDEPPKSLTRFPSMMGEAVTTTSSIRTGFCPSVSAASPAGTRARRKTRRRTASRMRLATNDCSGSRSHPPRDIHMTIRATGHGQPRLSEPEELHGRTAQEQRRTGQGVAVSIPGFQGYGSQTQGGPKDNGQHGQRCYGAENGRDNDQVYIVPLDGRVHDDRDHRFTGA